MSRTPLAFMSYVNDDDKYANGKITKFREHLSRAVKAHRGGPFEIFQDKNDIKWGQPWQERINDALDATIFLIPIITPSFFNSILCREELERFLKREKELGRNDLILPVYYIESPVLKDDANDTLAQIIATHQYTDWRDLRDDSFTIRKVRKALAKMAQQIIEALKRSEVDAARAEPVRKAVTVKAALRSNQLEKDGKKQQVSMVELLQQLAAIKPHLSILPEKAQANLCNAIEEAEQEGLEYNKEEIRESLKSAQDTLKDISNNAAAIHVGELLAKALIWCGRVL